MSSGSSKSRALAKSWDVRYQIHRIFFAGWQFSSESFALIPIKMINYNYC